MLEVLSRLPSEVAAFVLVLISALMALAWSFHTLMYGPRARLKRRLAAVTGAQPSQRRLRGTKRKSVQTRLKQVEEVRSKRRGYRLREELMQAGVRIEVAHYIGGCLLLAVVLFVVVRVVALSTPASLIVALIGGLGAPKLAIAMMARKRLASFTGQFADALDIIIRGVRSGLPLGECINIIGREMSDPVGGEFRLVSEGQKLGLNFQEALERAVERMPTPELRYFSIVIAIQQQTGGNLAETLAKLSDVLRARKRMRDKVQAFASEARASAYIIGSLPVIVMALLAVVAPQYVGLLFTTEVGNILLFIGGVTEAMGVLVMRKMINFDM
jgi:tight adherence protein B